MTETAAYVGTTYVDAQLKQVQKLGAVIVYAGGDKHHYAAETFTAKRHKFVHIASNGELQPVHSIDVLEVGSKICHVDRGSGQVSSFESKTVSTASPA
jgi:hypothetical protein